MKKQFAKITLFSLVTAALVAIPTISRADDSTNAPAASAPVKKHGTPFHGKAAAVDSAAMTITVGTLTVNITSDTKISKNGKPATLSDIAVGDVVSGAYKTDESGKLNATTVRDGLKAGKTKKKKAAAAGETSTNSAPN